MVLFFDVFFMYKLSDEKVHEVGISFCPQFIPTHFEERIFMLNSSCYS